jgi:hypothetical protein
VTHEYGKCCIIILFEIFRGKILALNDTDMIDAILYDSSANVVCFVIIYTESYKEDSLTIELLQAKFNRYLIFLHDGQFNQSYPQYIGKVIQFQLECTGVISLSLQEFLQDVNVIFLKEYNIKLVVNIHENH